MTSRGKSSPCLLQQMRNGLHNVDMGEAFNQQPGRDAPNASSAINRSRGGSCMPLAQLLSSIVARICQRVQESGAVYQVCRRHVAKAAQNSIHSGRHAAPVSDGATVPVLLQPPLPFFVPQFLSAAVASAVRVVPNR